ncbi:helix-turn-helix domain-containing protein [Paenibacillus hodogayensis]|uniref:Helix-turn-helix domain-containing protein n=1 Tax=Paenibacillus hodogayensis TaxID=279208 RepID=A0ABV5VWK7_9BACL
MFLRSYRCCQVSSEFGESSGGIHPFDELLYIREGHAALEWRGGCLEAPASSLFLLNRDTPHRLVYKSDKLSFWFIELDIIEPDWFVTEEQAICWNRLQAGKLNDSSVLRVLRQTLDSLTESLDNSEKGMPEFGEEIMLLDVKKTIRLIQAYLGQKPVPAAIRDGSTRELIHSLMRHMESNYFDDFNLETLAKIVHLNPSYLVRAFKWTAGITPIQYLHKLRLGAAISFLANTDMGVQQIAEATGFGSIHYFSRLFKQKYGVSPLQWRQAQRK